MRFHRTNYRPSLADISSLDLPWLLGLLRRPPVHPSPLESPSIFLFSPFPVMIFLQDQENSFVGIIPPLSDDCAGSPLDFSLLSFHFFRLITVSPILGLFPSSHMNHQGPRGECLYFLLSAAVFLVVLPSLYCLLCCLSAASSPRPSLS